ncbi:MAG: primosomal protein N' [Anaerolineales bacterium]|nr:primosomal protein N' [Anaerolineales bacterium]
MERFAEVALHLSRVQGTFTYLIPPALTHVLAPGHLVVVPFGPRRAQGIVLRRTAESPVAETRPIESLVDAQPVLTSAQLALADWLQRTTRAPLGECLALMIPAGLAQHADQLYSLVDPAVQPPPGTAARLVGLLRSRGPLRGRQIERHFGHPAGDRAPHPAGDWRRAVQGLMRRGVVTSAPVLDAPAVAVHRVRSARLAQSAEQVTAAFEDLGRGDAAIRRRRVLEALLQEGRPLDLTWLYAEAGARPGDLSRLRDRGLIALDAHEQTRDPLAGSSAALSLPPDLTPEQLSAWESIAQSLHSAGGAFLLHGVTGSGKTEIYLRAVARVLQDGASAIVLVPEIALTPQTTDRFLSRFPGRVGVIHSALSAGERFDTWRRARSGELSVIIGARRLIVVDEEHDESYKEREIAVRYHARSAALAYAGLLNAVCLLGSATPDIVTYHRAVSGEIRLLELPRRLMSLLPGEGPRPDARARPIELPPVHVVDMRQELKAGNTALFSRRLTDALAATLDRGEQAILFLNRRGSATYVFCRDCGWVARCPRCETPLVHHPTAAALQCHQCGTRRKPPTVCPQCRGRRVRYFGAGTQRIEAEVEARFPGVRCLRWDWDATRRKGAHEVILAHFAAHRADILIGTQMLAKGLDLPLVTLVGVVSADTGLFMPDYRAAERTFQVLTQVAGRAGRGQAGGQVILQTYHPEHEAIRAASTHDFHAFYQAELRHRRELGYPPFRRLARLLLRGTSLERVQDEAARLGSRLRRAAARSGQPVEVLGPTPCFFTRQRGWLRWQIVLRGADPASIVPDDLPEGWTIDVDPVSLL